MSIFSRRMRLVATCTLIGAIATSFSLEPVIAQSGSASWQVVDSINMEADGFAPALSPDGLWVAGLKDIESRQLCVWKVSTGEERCNEESERVADASIAWSPDSRQVAFSQNGAELDSDVFVLDVRSNSLTNLTEDDVDDLKEASTASQFVIYDEWPVWSPDGSELLFIRILNPRDEQGQRQIAVSRVIMETGQVVRGQDMVTDEPLAYIAETVGMITPLLWLADGTVIVSIRGGSDIAGVYTADVNSGPPVKIVSTPSIPASISPVLTGATASGDRLTMYWLWDEIAIDGEFYSHTSIDLETGELSPIEVDIPRRMFLAAPPRFSPDGTSVAYGVTEDEATHQDSTIVIQDLETGETTEIVDGVDLQLWESITGIEWTANNQMVVPLSDGTFQIVTVEQS